MRRCADRLGTGHRADAAHGVATARAADLRVAAVGRAVADGDKRLFWEPYSVPFRMGFVDGGARGVMASYNAWNGTPMAVNPTLKSIVEHGWGVDVLSSDGGAVRLLWADRKRYADQQAAVIACLQAGIHQFLDTYSSSIRTRRRRTRP